MLLKLVCFLALLISSLEAGKLSISMYYYLLRESII